MQTSHAKLNIDKAIGFPECKRNGAPSRAARRFAAAVASRCGTRAYVTSVDYMLIFPPVKIPFRNKKLHIQLSSVGNSQRPFFVVPTPSPPHTGGCCGLLLFVAFEQNLPFFTISR